MKCHFKALGIQCNRPHGHQDAHAIGTPRELNKFFPRFPNSENEWKCPAGCAKTHA